MRGLVIIVIMLVATIMLIGFCITSCGCDDEPKEHAEQAQDEELHFIYVPLTNGGFTAVPVFY